MARVIPLTEMINSVAANDGRPILILDTSGNSETFFKYKGSLIMTYVPGDATEMNLRAKFKHSVTKGDHLVLSMARDDVPQNHFTPEHLPE
jgi:hypothetical protein